MIGIHVTQQRLADHRLIKCLILLYIDHIIVLVCLLLCISHLGFGFTIKIMFLTV